jgi:hypothetical protein
MQIPEGRKIFVHCIRNYRVSAFMFHYLHNVQVYSAEAAKSPMFERRKIEPQGRQVLDLSAEDFGL